VLYYQEIITQRQPRKDSKTGKKTHRSQAGKKRLIAGTEKTQRQASKDYNKAGKKRLKGSHDNDKIHSSQAGKKQEHTQRQARKD
jgi:hypothetical protein